MTKERLEELIKQGATIWSNVMWYHGKIHLINSDTDEYRIIEDNFDNVYLSHHTKGTDDCYDGQWDLEDLREDVDRAEWEYKMYAERTERFEPPMWEEICKEYEFNFLYRQVVRPSLYFVRHIRFAVYLYDNLNQICIYDVDDVDFEKKFKGKATKENYEKACEIVRDLFKGEK